MHPEILSRGYRPQIPVLSVLCPQLNLLNKTHPEKKKITSSVYNCTVKY